MPNCALCNNEVEPLDLESGQEVTAWQIGQADEQREYTGRVAHTDCIIQLSERPASDQEPLF